MKTASLVAALALGAIAAPAWAQAPRGAEFQVNETTTGLQDAPVIAGDASGNFVVAWTDLDQDGDSYGVVGRRFDASGAALGPEFRVNTYTTSAQALPSVAADASGRFVVTWLSVGQDGSYWGIFAQRYDATGAELGEEFRVNTYTLGFQDTPAVASDPDGDFVVVWSGQLRDGSSYAVLGQRYDATGVPRGAEFVVNSYTTGSQGDPAVAFDASGNFVVVWSSRYQDGSGQGVFGQRFDASGARRGGEFRVNTFTTGSQYTPVVTSDPAGRFVVAWSSVGEDGSNAGVFARRYDTAGAAVGDPFRVNSHTTGHQRQPSLASDADGDFIVTWHSVGQDGSGAGIFARRYDREGTPLGAEFQVNSFTTSDQIYGAVASAPEGDFVVAWSSLGQDGDATGVFAQRFVPDLIFEDGFDAEVAPACDPDGVYTKTGTPIGYTCCLGTVSVSIQQFLFSQDGAKIMTAPSNPAVLSGTATSCPAGAFDNSATEAGSCAITYRLTGAFIAENAWSGTYSLAFSGSGCACSGFGSPCTSQTFGVTATR